ncbi:MAG: prepilin-type N-terminal cleavage/methylation domain-containing protein [Candidatus Sumerlaeia bacterium]|nr:prepilin-type N-terminal cleavage/methylation domain-containing protein [Candidatus Sumerlaeia bacterium]
MKKGFTLIELLIVVAIIAILAAIAVPNFLEAQTRAKVSRAASDMRTLDTALAAYFVDNNKYPQCNDRGVPIAYNNATTNTANGAIDVLERLSTPIAYVTTPTFRDAFSVKFRKSAATASAMVVATPSQVTPGTDVFADINGYGYQAVNPAQRATVATGTFEPALVNATGFFLFSVGPDNTYYNLGGVLDNHETADEPILLIYDATNGTISEGDIWRANGQTSGDSNYWAGKGLREAINRSGK